MCYSWNMQISSVKFINICTRLQNKISFRFFLMTFWRFFLKFPGERIFKSPLENIYWTLFYWPRVLLESQCMKRTLHRRLLYESSMNEAEQWDDFTFSICTLSVIKLLFSSWARDSSFKSKGLAWKNNYLSNFIYDFANYSNLLQK